MNLLDSVRSIWPFFGNQSGPVVNEGLQGESLPQRPSAVRVASFDTAMQVSTWWACCRLLVETIAAMPLDCYKTVDGKKEKTEGHNLWRVLNFTPNAYQTTTEFFECLCLNLVAGGNWYCLIQYANNDPTKRVVGLIPLMNTRVKVHLIKGALVYEYTAPDGTTVMYPQKRIWHVKIFGNGVTGLSPLQNGAATLGIAAESRDRASTLASSGGKTNGILMIDRILEPEQRAQIRKNFAGLTEGAAEDDLWILESNMKFERTSLSPGDAQLLESWKFSVEEICRFFGIPSILVNDTTASTAWGSGIQQIVQGFYKLTLNPYLIRIQTSIQRWLLPPREWGNVEFVFDFDALLKLDMLARFQAFSTAINSGQVTSNEVRAIERRPPKPGGDELFINGSLRPVKLAAKDDKPNTAGGRRVTDNPPDNDNPPGGNDENNQN